TVKFVLTRSELFKPTFSASKEKILGKQATFSNQCDYHKQSTKVVLRAFTPYASEYIVSDIETLAKDSFQSWEEVVGNKNQSDSNVIKISTPPNKRMNIMALRRSLVVGSRRRALSIVHASRSKTFLRKIELSAFSRSTNPFPRDLGCFGVDLGWAIGDGELVTILMADLSIKLFYIESM
ncbi:hypothetical protein G4B88_001816, partial [Cannabis sativa]